MASKSLRRKPKQERSQVMVDAILEAATQILLEADYASASTNRIAKRAGVSVGSIYQYFDNKLEIFESVLAGVFNRMMKNLAETEIDSQAGLEESLFKIAYQIYGEWPQAPIFLQKMKHISESSLSEVTENSKVAIIGYIRYLLLIKTGKRLTEESDPQLRFLVNALEGIYLNLNAESQAEPVAREIARMASRYLVSAENGFTPEEIARYV